jgi:DNA-binding transcriptional MerR regulator
MFLGEVCRELGISVMAYRRLEVAGKVPEAPRRKGIGGVMARVFKKQDLARLKALLNSRRPPSTTSRT